MGRIYDKYCYLLPLDALEDIKRLEDQIDWLEERVHDIKLENAELENEIAYKAVEIMESAVKEIDIVGQELARQFGVHMPSLWYLENNRVLELLWGVQRKLDYDAKCL
jgi:hypothetical protein